MAKERDPRQKFTTQETLHPERVSLLNRIEVVSVVLGLIFMVIRHGLPPDDDQHLELGLVVLLAMVVISVGSALSYRWSLSHSDFLEENRYRLLINGGWLLGVLGILIFAPRLEDAGLIEGRRPGLAAISELALSIWGLIGGIRTTRAAAARGWNPAVLLVASFLLMIAVGTLLLMLPRARTPNPKTGELVGAPFRVALFTATSACCVTGLVIEPTGTYWSRLGQGIILGMIQLGGLGIMTCGAFFALAAGQGFRVRERATLRDLLDSDALGDVRRLVRAILLLTLGIEAVGAILISGLFSDLSPGNQFFWSVFHSVSAFCNAGFALTENSFDHWATRWQIWGVISLQIIIGGLGFAVLYNMALLLRSRVPRFEQPTLFKVRGQKRRLSLTSRLVLIVTGILLFGGALIIYLLESVNPMVASQPLSQQIANAWFQSVTFRTAGFNTVDHVDLQPSTKLFAIMLMFVGASPGSTGGGIKTVCFAVAVLALGAVLRGRRNVEIFGRTVPDSTIYRALSIISLGMMIIMVSTLLLVLFEHQPSRFLDHMFEATSAFCTVGVSANVTSNLKASSQYVLIVTMFLGRVGPLTLMLALAGPVETVHYQYPEERVLLG